MTALERALASLHNQVRATSAMAVLPTVLSRIVDRLTHILVVADDLLAEFQTEEANPLLWAEPLIRRTYDEVSSTLSRIAQ